MCSIFLSNDFLMHWKGLTCPATLVREDCLCLRVWYMLFVCVAIDLLCKCPDISLPGVCHSEKIIYVTVFILCCLCLVISIICVVSVIQERSFTSQGLVHCLYALWWIYIFFCLLYTCSGDCHHFLILIHIITIYHSDKFIKGFMILAWISNWKWFNMWNKM